VDESRQIRGSVLSSLGFFTVFSDVIGCILRVALRVLRSSLVQHRTDILPFQCCHPI